MDLTPVRTWAVNWVAGGDPLAAGRCLAEDYTLRIGTFTLTPRSSYVDATLAQLERYPGLGLTVHDLITDGTHTVVRASEHGASSRHGGAAASWRVIAVFEHAGPLITRGWAEEDYWARRRQLAAGVADPVEAPALAPWSAVPLTPEPGVEEAVRAWVAAGAPGVLRDDADLVPSYEAPLSCRSGELDVLVVSGRRAGFHAVLSGDGALLPAAGLVDVAADGTISGHLVTDRLGLPR